MLNQIVIVGKIASMPNMTADEPTVLVEIDRSFKNSHGNYETDIIPVHLWRGMIENVNDTCQVGSLIGIKGRIAMDNEIVTLIGEKFSVLTAREDSDYATTPSS
jgi:single-stranded DNA-binding protein